MSSSSTAPSARVHSSAPVLCTLDTETSAKTEQHAVVEPPKSPVRKALELVRWRLGPGLAGPCRVEDLEWCEISMSLSQWGTLRSMPETNDEDRQYPRLSYNAVTSTLIIQCMPSPLHQSISGLVAEAIGRWKTSLLKDQRSGVHIIFNEDQVLTTRPWAGSRKAPDLGLRVRSNGKDGLKWVMEVFFSETYESLKKTASLWLEGMANQVDMVVLVNFEEDPPYRCPLSANEDPNTRGIPDIKDIPPQDFSCEGSLGPATYKDLIWAGRIGNVSMETWVRGEDGKAKYESPAKDLLSEATMEIPVGNLLHPPYHGTIVVDLDEFRDELPRNICRQAWNRCTEAVRLWNKRMGVDVRDEDYEEQQAEDMEED